MAADRPLTELLLQKQITAIAYETVELPDGALPLLKPMSEVAGRMAIQAAALCLESPNGGAGLLLGGVPGTPAARVTIIGGGVAGTEGAKIAVGMRAIVRVLDLNAARLAYLSDIFGGRLDLVIPNRVRMAAYVQDSDVVVDVAIDQGGCFETSRPTTHSQPTYVEKGVIHYCVTNIPAAVARTSTLALTSVTLPYLVQIADQGAKKAVAADPALAKGLSTIGGHLVSQAVAGAHGLPYVPAVQVLR